MNLITKAAVLTACLTICSTSHAELFVLGDITPAAYLAGAQPDAPAEAPAQGNVELFKRFAEDTLSLGRVYFLGTDPVGIQKQINHFFASLQLSMLPISWCEALDLSPSDLLIILNPDPSCEDTISSSALSHLKAGGNVLVMFEWQPLPSINNTWLQGTNRILERIGSTVRIDSNRVSIGNHIAHPTEHFPSGIGAVHFGAAHPVVGGETWLEDENGIGFLSYDAGPFR